MRTTRRTSTAIVLAALAIVAACAQPSTGTPTSGARQEQPPQPAALKRIAVAVSAEPAALHRALLRGGVTQVLDITDLFLNMGMTVVDDRGVRQPALGEAVPTIENGFWKVQPDGQMELVWKIKPGVTWHDGTPFTADDLQFTLDVLQDRDFPEFRGAGTDLIERYEIVDPRTLSTTWRRPFIRADRLFSGASEGVGQIIPKHLLERTYTENKEGFRQQSYWTTEYVGLGPYKLRDWTHGSNMVLTANDRFVLGKPKIDEVDVRFILDPNAVEANILSGAVQATVGTGISLEQSAGIRDQWRDGQMLVTYENWILAYPQFVNPNPQIVTDLRFRRALLMAIDRQSMAEIIQLGLVPVAHGYIRPDEPEYGPTESAVVKYDFDPRRSAQMLQELGYTRGGGDNTLRDAAGQTLRMEVRATTSPEIHTKSFFPVVDYWQGLGIVIDSVVIPLQRTADLEYRTTHPSFEVMRHPVGAGSVDRLHSSQAPLAENRFFGSNRARYQNPEFDAMIDTYVATIPWEPRMAALRAAVHHMSDQLNVMGLFYDLRTTMVANKIVNMPANNPTWNVHLWDLRS